MAKEILVYPLHANWRAQLQANAGEAATPVRPAKAPEVTQFADWAEQEFSGFDLPDARLQNRLYSLARDFYACPTGNIPQACDSRAKTKAAYRFFDHDKTTMDTLLPSHYRATEARARSESIILAVQDTTSFN